MPVTLYIQDCSGDHNLETILPNNDVLSARVEVGVIKNRGGYWTKDRYDRDVFVPWHRIDFIRFEKSGE